MPNFRPFSACWGDISFTQAPHTTTRCYAGAIFLSCNPPGAPRRGGHRRNRAHLETQSLAAVPVGGGGAWPDNESTRRATHQRPGATGVEGAGGTGGPGRGAGGWRQGQGGPRDRPLRAVRLACGDLAGGPPPTGTHSGPAPKQHNGAPGTPAVPHSDNMQRQRRAGGPPPTGAPSSPARRVRPDGARNTSGAASTTGARAKRPYSPPPPGSGRPV